MSTKLVTGPRNDPVQYSFEPNLVTHNLWYVFYLWLI